jgi:hypothetical protein
MLMKKFFALALILFSTPTFAQETKTYRPFRYESPCLLEQGIQTYPDTCVEM